jgi:vacuolar protein sorting-associated protein VTA1
MNPGLWSNTATPGGEFLHEDSPIKRPTFANRHAKFSEDDDAWSHAADIGSRQNSYRNPANTLDADDDANDISSSPLSTAMVSPPDPATQSHAVVKQVRWTPSVTGGSSTTSSPPPASPEMFHPTLDSLPERHIEEENGILDVHDPTPPELDTFIVSQQQAAPSSHRGHGHVDLYPSAPADEPHSLPAPLRNPFPTHTYIPSAPPPLPPPPAAMDVELTNAIIAKVQKHCRFAISSLDYEDAEQARKELRTALDLLGG